MEVRKNKKYDLGNYRVLFFNIGLVIALLMVIGAFEWRFYETRKKKKVSKKQRSFGERNFERDRFSAIYFEFRPNQY